MNPMETFDPDEPCRVHDGLNNNFIEWNPESEPYDGVISWDGALLDGWVPR